MNDIAFIMNIIIIFLMLLYICSYNKHWKRISNSIQISRLKTIADIRYNGDFHIVLRNSIFTANYKIHN